MIKLNEKFDIWNINNKYDKIYNIIKDLGWNRIDNTLVFYKEISEDEYEVIFSEDYPYFIQKLDDILKEEYSVEKLLHWIKNHQSLVLCSKKFLKNCLLDCAYTHLWKIRDEDRIEKTINDRILQLVEITKNYEKISHTE